MIEPEHDRRSTDARVEELEAKLVIGLKAAVVAGVIFLIASTAAIIWIASVASDASDAAADSQTALDKAEVERSARIDTVAQLVERFCSKNNVQDLQLAHLLAASTGSAFGENVDPSTLTPFDVQVLATIAKVAAAPSQFDRRSERVLRRLRRLDDCEGLVNSYLAGEPLDSSTPNRGGGDDG